VRQWQTLNRYWKKMSGLRRSFDSMYQWLAARDARTPVFMMANITSAHYPWAPPLAVLWRRLGRDVRYLNNQEFVTPSPFRFNSEKQKVSDQHRRTWRALYEAAIIHLDQELGRFLSLLRRWSGWSNTVLIITADHGELLGEYRDIVGHTLCLHDHLLHVPLIIRHPDHSTGAMIEGVVQSLDLYSSILEWSSIPDGEIPNAQRQRTPLSAAVTTPGDCSGLAFAEEDYTDSYNPIQGLLKVNPEMDPQKYPQQQIAVRSATHKYIWFNDQPAEFYDLVADSAEANNLINTDAAEERNHLAMLQHSLTTWRANLELFPPRAVNEMEQLEPEMVERLRVLGYVV
jgi:arylsulfatase A-like enzyme